MSGLNPDLVMLIATTGLLLGLSSLLYFIYKRLSWLFGFFSKQKVKLPGLIKSIRNLIIIFIWIGFFIFLLVLGFFMRAYDVFTFEKPVAEISVKPVSGKHISRLVFLENSDTINKFAGQIFELKADQWVLEGDIIKWDTWVNLLGVQTRYRFTRIRGRYLSVEDELKNPPEIYSLVPDEQHPLWKYFYRYGHKLPFVNTVYGNAVFQSSERDARFRIFVGNSGFIVKRIDDDSQL